RVADPQARTRWPPTSGPAQPCSPNDDLANRLMVATPRRMQSDRPQCRWDDPFISRLPRLRSTPPSSPPDSERSLVALPPVWPAPVAFTVRYFASPARL